MNAEELARRIEGFFRSRPQGYFRYRGRTKPFIGDEAGQIVPITQRELMDTAKAIKPTAKASV